MGRVVVRSYYEYRQSAKLEAALRHAAEELNKRAPLVLDEDTRLDRTSVESGGRLTHHYTFHRRKASEIDMTFWKSTTAPDIRARALASHEISYLFEIGATSVYSYRGNDGVLVDEIVITPDDYRKKK